MLSVCSESCIAEELIAIDGNHPRIASLYFLSTLYRRMFFGHVSLVEYSFAPTLYTLYQASVSVCMQDLVSLSMHKYRVSNNTHRLFANNTAVSLTSQYEFQVSTEREASHLP